MRIQFLKSHGSYAYFANDVAELPEAKAKELINKGFAKQLEAETLPEDMPARELLIESGFNTMGDLKEVKADDLTAIKGIGPKTAEEIIEYIK